MDTQPDPEKEPAPEQRSREPAAPSFCLTDYQRMTMAELCAAAESAGLAIDDDEAVDTELDRQQLVFALQTKNAPPDATGTAVGILDVHPEGFGFLRSPHHGCLPGADDVYLGPNQVRRLRLRSGQKLECIVRAPNPGEKYFATLRVLTIDGGSVNKNVRRVPFRYLAPVLPHTRLPLSYPRGPASLRLLDLFSPLGLGQRVLLRTPPGSRRGELFADIASGVLHNRPDATLIVLFADQRPEERAAIARSFVGEPRAEVFATDFDVAPERHAAVMNLVTARLQRLAEARREVVLLVDSLTALVRAENSTVPHSGKIIATNLDADALRRPKQLFSCARQTEEGASVTIIATLLVDTDSPRDTAIAEEFRGKENATVKLDTELIEQHLFPAIDLSNTRTRREDNLLSKDELDQHHRLRSRLDGLSKEAALRNMLELLETSPKNEDLLRRPADS